MKMLSHSECCEDGNVNWCIVMFPCRRPNMSVHMSVTSVFFPSLSLFIHVKNKIHFELCVFVIYIP